MSAPLGLDFFRNYYADGLDNQLVTFSVCETGNTEGGALAAAMGGDNFVMTGWTEVVHSTTAFPTTLAFYEELAKGLTTSEAFDNIADLGLFPVINTEGNETSFEVFSPGNDDIRIIELPRLIYKDAVMPKGVNLAGFVTGRIDDANPDMLKLTVQIDGVTEDEKSNFAVRYRVNDQDVPGSYDLDMSTLVSGFEYRYEVIHDLDLGFPLASGPLPLEVIVDLPEGGDSRYFVEASLNATLNLDLGWYAASSIFDPALEPDVDQMKSAYFSKPLFPQPGDMLTPPDPWWSGIDQSVSTDQESAYVQSVRDDKGAMHDIVLSSSTQIEAELTSTDGGSAALSMNWSTNAECEGIPNSAEGVACSDARAQFDWNPVFWIEVTEDVSYEARFTLSCSGGGPDGGYGVGANTSLFRHVGGSASSSFPNGGTGDALYINALNPFDAPPPPPVNYPISASDFVCVPGDDPIDVKAVFHLRGPTDPEVPDIVALVILVSSFSLSPVDPFEVFDPVPGDYGQAGSVTSSVSVKPFAP